MLSEEDAAAEPLPSLPLPLDELLGVISDVPARALELHGRRRDQLLQLAAAMRADSQWLIGKFLDPLGQAMALLALVFVERHGEFPKSF